MPRSKRNRVVTLSKVKKSDAKDKKDDLIEKIQDAVENHKYCFVLNVENQRNELLKEVRAFFSKQQDGKKGVLFMGNNNIMRLALGNSVENEIFEKISHLAEKIQNECALLCCDMEPSEVQRFFMEFQRETFARAGLVPSEQFVIPKGELALPFSMEQHLRSLGLPTILKDGKIQMLSDYTVCTPTKPLTVDQCQLLKLFEQKLALFRMQPIGVWSKEGASYRNINAPTK